MGELLTKSATTTEDSLWSKSESELNLMMLSVYQRMAITARRYVVAPSTQLEEQLLNIPDDHTVAVSCLMGVDRSRIVASYVPQQNRLHPLHFASGQLSGIGTNNVCFRMQEGRVLLHEAPIDTLILCLDCFPDTNDHLDRAAYIQTCRMLLSACEPNEQAPVDIIHFTDHETKYTYFDPKYLI